MHYLKSIREHLGVSQRAMADGLGCTQANVSNYENGQTLPPGAAGRLIEYAQSFGVDIGFDHVYGGARLPELAKKRHPTAEQA